MLLTIDMPAASTSFGSNEADDEQAPRVTEGVVLRCRQCGEAVETSAGEQVLVCADCGSAAPVALESHAGVNGSIPVGSAALLGDPGEYLCFEEGEEIVVVRLTRERTRIGRGLEADVRLGDPTVSRRHALLVRGPAGVRVLDDQSLNGVFVNGRCVASSPLAHGDEIRLGRRRLYFATGQPVGVAASTNQRAA